MSEYNEQYADDLVNGMRFDGKTDIECCLEWGILYSEYKKWVQDIPEFAKAHEIGQMHYAAHWHKMARNLAAKGNASVLTAGMKNLDVRNWVDKKDSEVSQEEPIRAIEITILPPRVDDDDSSD